MFDFRINIAEKIIEFKSNDPLLDYDAHVERAFSHFVYTGSRRSDIVFDIHRGRIPAPQFKKRLFTIGRNWFVSECGDAILFECSGNGFGMPIEHGVCLAKDMKRGTIYIRTKEISSAKKEKMPVRFHLTEEQKLRQERRRKQKEKERAMLASSNADMVLTRKVWFQRRRLLKDYRRRPARRIITIVKTNFLQAFLPGYLLQEESGLSVHGAAVQHDGKLSLFMGQSSSGKSTLARLWHESCTARVLNDDRGILISEGGKVYFYNTPWAGSLMQYCDFASGRKTNVDALFFIHHDSANRIRKLNHREAFIRIYRNSFLAFWRKEALRYVLDTCLQIAASIPCYELGFVNNGSIVAFLQKEAY